MAYLVSVILPVHNGERFLAEAIASIFAQNYNPLQVIIVNDGSTDGTMDLVAGAAATYGNGILAFSQAQSGPAAARNRGIAHARGDVIAFLDHDDLWAPNFLRRHTAYLAEHAEIDIVQGRIVQMQLVRTDNAPDGSAFEPSSEPYQFISLSSAIYRKSVFERVGGLDERLWDADDTDWFMRAWEKNVPKVVLEDVVLYARRHDTNLTGARGPRTLPRVFKLHLDRLRAVSGNLQEPAPNPARTNPSEYLGLPPKALTLTAMNLQNEELHSLQAELRLAKVWQQRGRTERAMEGFRRVLERQPNHLEAQQCLADSLLLHKRLPEAIAVYAHALEAYPNEARLHKGLTNALVAQDGLAAAFAHYDLSRADSKMVDARSDDVLCSAVVRNEALRLPFFLNYYRAQGIAKFFVVDNDSNDNTLDLLLAQPDVYVWRSPLSFKRANFGSAWFELLLRCYGLNHWWLMVDADELLYYSNCETLPLPQLCRELERRGKKALNAVLLDMYSDVPIRDTHYRAGQDFREVCPFFDRDFSHQRYAEEGPYRNQTAFLGGMRTRVFGAQDNFYLTKVPLLKYDASVILAGGQHWTNRPIQEIAEMLGCLLHFKYLETFPPYVEQEVGRKEHADGAVQYSLYAQALAQDPALTLYHPEHSVRLESSAQLVQMGIMQKEADAAPHKVVRFPLIKPVPTASARPFWSVLITVYDRTEFLRTALEAVLAQGIDASEMQLVVVNDGASADIRQQLEQIVSQCDKNRVEFYATPQNLGHPAIFNACIERAQGKWIHLLHDDDWVAEGFYARLRAGIEQDNAVGAAFCRQCRHSETGTLVGTSWLERETPGRLDDWLERIAVDCRLQASAMVVKREVYQALGGYTAAAGSAFDWEMWIRIACNYPVWYDPQPLAHFRQHRGALSYQLIKAGAQIAAARKAIKISRASLPAEQRDTLTSRAYRNYARYALEHARKYLEVGDAEAALANVREGLLCSQAPEIQAELIALLTECKGDR